MATAQETKGKARPRARAKSAESKRATQTRHGAESTQEATIPIPVPAIHTKRVSVPATMGQAKQSVTGQLRPSRGLLFYGGLAAVAAFGVIDWPVAAAIGIGTVIARRGRS
jgi:hypothetical protein